MGSVQSREEEFYKWLSGRVSSKLLSQSYESVSKINQYYRTKGYFKLSLFEIDDIQILKQLNNNIFNGKSFKRFFPGQQYYAHLVMMHYINYIQESVSRDNRVEKTAPVTEVSSNGLSAVTDRKTSRTEFYTWLQNSSDKGKADSIIKNLDLIDSLLCKYKVTNRPIYEIENETELNNIIDIVKKNTVIRIGILEKLESYINALELYIEYTEQNADSFEKELAAEGIVSTQMVDKTKKVETQPKVQKSISQRTIEFIRSTEQYKEEKTKFMAWLKKEGYSAVTINIYTKALERGSQYALSNGLLNTEIMQMQKVILLNAYTTLYSNRKLKSITSFGSALGAIVRYRSETPVIGDKDDKTISGDESQKNQAEFEKAVSSKPNAELIKVELNAGDSITEKLTEHKIRFIDKRKEGDKLYIVRGEKADEIIDEFKMFGIEFEYKSSLRAWVTSDSYYEKNDSDYESVQPQSELAEGNNTEIGGIQEKLENNSIRVAGSDTQHNSVELCSDSNSNLVVDFSKDKTYKFTQPVSVTYFGETTYASSWRKIYVNTCQHLLNDYPSAFKRIRNAGDRGINGLIFSKSHTSKWASPACIGGDYYVATQRSATDLMHNLKMLIDYCNVSYKDVFIVYRRIDQKEVNGDEDVCVVNTDSTKTSPQEPHSNDKEKNISGYTVSQGRLEFTNWLKLNHKGRIIAAISWTLTKISEFAIEIGVISEHLYIICDPEDLTQIFSRLEMIPAYSDFKLRNTYADFAANTYVEFRKKQQKKNNSRELIYNSGNNSQEISDDIVDSKQYRKDEKTVVSQVAITDNHADEVSDNVKIQDSPEMEAELLAMLEDKQFEPLRTALISKGITKMHEFEELNLWVFMNQNGLYNINLRFFIYNNLRKKLENKKQVGQRYEIKTNSASYVGTTSAEAFLRYCESVSQKAPLKFRSLINKPDLTSGKTIIKRNNTNPTDLKLTNPVAYIDFDIDSDTALRYAKYVGAFCQVLDIPISIDISEPTENTLDQECKNSERTVHSCEEEHVMDVENVSEERDEQLEEDISAGDFSTKEESIEEDEVEIQYADKEEKQVEELLLNADLEGMDLYHLVRSLPHSRYIALKQICVLSPKIIELENKYVHVDAFVDFEEAADTLYNIIEKLLTKNDGYVSASQLFEYARSEMQMFLNDNDVNDEKSVYSIAQYLFNKVGWKGKHYLFTNGNHISRDGKDALYTNLDVILKFARDNDGFFEYDSLLTYLQQVGIKTGNLRNQMYVGLRPDFFYYSSTEMITAESMQINNQWLLKSKKAFERLFDDVGDHIVLRSINPAWYDQLPALPAYRPWTPLLLQYVLRFYGKELGARTIGSGLIQRYDTIHSMLVSDESELQSFADIVAAYIIDQGIEQRKFETEQLRRILVYGDLIAKNELISKIPNAIGSDPRFAWDVSGKNVTIKV